MTDAKLRRAQRHDPLSLAAFRERVRAGLVGGLIGGCEACQGSGRVAEIPSANTWAPDQPGYYSIHKRHRPETPYTPWECAECDGNGESPPSARVFMASFLHHLEALRECWPGHSVGNGYLGFECYGDWVGEVGRRWGPVAAAACVRGATEACGSLRNDWGQMSQPTYAAAVSVIGEDRAREAARQAGIRWALGVDE